MKIFSPKDIYICFSMPVELLYYYTVLLQQSPHRLLGSIFCGRTSLFLIVHSFFSPPLLSTFFLYPKAITQALRHFKQLFTSVSSCLLSVRYSQKIHIASNESVSFLFYIYNLSTNIPVQFILFYKNKLHPLLFSFFSYIDPSRLITETTVFQSNLMSIPTFHSLIYSVSSFTTSSKSVISLLPLTCHIPVIPGLIASLAL